MASALEQLQQLQAVELKLAELRRTRQGKKRRVNALRRKVEAAQEKLDAEHRELREKQARLDSLALDVASREESINKHRQALSKAKTNKEYAAILTAMNTEKADNAKIENAMLELMEEIQGLKESRGKAESERAKMAEDVRGAEEALSAFDEQSRDQREELEKRREEFASRMAPTVLHTFERAAQRHDGEAMAPIRKIHPKRDEYVCSGCNMNVTLEVINALQTRDELQICGACGRILYVEAFEGRGGRSAG